MKVMCIMNQNILNVKSGGGQCSKRNYDAIKESLEEGDVLYICMISPEFAECCQKEKELWIPGLRGNIQSAVAAMQGCKCCTKANEKKIWKYIDAIRPEIIYLDTSKLGHMAKKLKKKYGSKILVFFHNVESDYSQNLIKNRGKQYLLSYWASLGNEKKAVRYADKMICLTEKDSNRINELYGRRPDEIIPISFADSYDESRCTIRRENGLLFIGSLFPPNYDGIKWFVEEIMDKIPEQMLTIVGKDFEKKTELERENVKVVGTVEHLEDYYYAYPVIVMPILYGAGMKVKTAEAMMYGKVILATDEALEGYNVSEADGVYKCNTQEEFIAAIRRVFCEPIDFKNSKIRKKFLTFYEYRVIQKQFEKLIKSLGKRYGAM